MSESLNSFIVRVGKPIQPSEYDGTAAYLNHAQQTSDSSFLTNQSDATESFLNLSEPLASVSGTSRIEVSGKEVTEHISVNNDEGMEDGITGGPLLYLDPASGLHVLVHSLCQTFQHSAVPQDNGVTPEQFVVVGALEADEEPMVIERTLEGLESKTPNLGSSRSVDTILRSPMISLRSSTRDDPTVHHIFSSAVEPTLDLDINIPSTQNYICAESSYKGTATSLDDINTTITAVDGEKLQHKDATQMVCEDPSLIKLHVTEGTTINSGDLQRDILMEAVPHINLEEIIEKFTSENTNQLIQCNKTDIMEDKSTHEFATSIENVSIPQEPLPMQKSFSIPMGENLKSPQRSSVTVKLTNVSDMDESLDEESLYDIVMTYKCKLCSEVFMEKARLIEHYKELHKPKKGVKICVKSKSSAPLGALNCDTGNIVVKRLAVSTSSSDTSGQKSRDGHLQTCKYCFQFMGNEQECLQHIAKDHPNETRKKSKQSFRRVLGGLTMQPGMLIGHREERLQNHSDTDCSSKPGIQKRRIKAPQELKEQFFLQKQKVKPVLHSEMNKSFKCPVSSCRYKFSSKQKLQEHEEYHVYSEDDKGSHFLCIHCSEKFRKWSLCQFHIWQVHGIDLDLLTCGICHTYKTNTEQKLNVHQKIHSETRDYVCSDCGKGFHQAAQLLNHEVQHMKNDEDLPPWSRKCVCSECDKQFGDKKALKRHMDTVHLKIKRNSCPHCPYKCLRLTDLRVHIRKHTGEKPHQCELCGHWYRDYSTIRRHKWIHFANKPFKCPDENCQFEGVCGSRFKKHMAKHHPKLEAVYKCEVCSMSTQNIQMFVSHFSSHEEQLFQEALQKRRGNLTSSLNSQSLEETVALRVNSNIVDKATNGHINIGEFDDILLQHDAVEERKNHIGENTSRTMKPKSVVLQSDEVVCDVINQNPHIYTINVGLKSSHSPLEKCERTSMGSSDADNHSVNEELRLDKILKTHVLDSGQNTSMLGVSEDNIVHSKLLEANSHGTTVLKVVENGHNVPVLDVGDQTLVTFSQVYSQDGHQYIIGISPEDISSNNIANETNIFTISHDER